MSNTTNLSKYYSPIVYKYFGETSLSDINKKLIEYKKNPKDLKLLEEFGKRLNIGLKKLKKDKNDDLDCKNNDLDLVEERFFKIYKRTYC